MSNLRYWASGVLVAALTLLGPILAFVLVVAAEMLMDLVANAGATVIWPVVVGAMTWVLLSKFGRQGGRNGPDRAGPCLATEEVRPGRRMRQARCSGQTA